MFSRIWLRHLFAEGSISVAFHLQYSSLDLKEEPFPPGRAHSNLAAAAQREGPVGLTVATPIKLKGQEGSNIAHLITFPTADLCHTNTTTIISVVVAYAFFDWLQSPHVRTATELG
jgi:hypothetical protein